MHTKKSDKAHISQIKTRADFVKIQSKGKKWVSHGLTIQTMPNEQGLTRVGFTVTKRVDKSAVNRNRMKRRLRAVAADVLSKGALTGHDYILVGRAQTLKRPYGLLCKDLRWCLRKLDLAISAPEELPDHAQENA